MKNVFEYEVEFSREGRCVKRRVTIGGILIWGMVLSLLGLAGHAACSIPASLCASLLKRP